MTEREECIAHAKTLLAGTGYEKMVETFLGIPIRIVYAITDLLHLAQSQNHNIEMIVDHALLHYREEVALWAEEES